MDMDKTFRLTERLEIPIALDYAMAQTANKAQDSDVKIYMLVCEELLLRLFNMESLHRFDRAYRIENGELND